MVYQLRMVIFHSYIFNDQRVNKPTTTTGGYHPVENHLTVYPGSKCSIHSVDLLHNYGAIY